MHAFYRLAEVPAERWCLDDFVFDARQDYSRIPSPGSATKPGWVDEREPGLVGTQGSPEVPRGDIDRTAHPR